MKKIMKETIAGIILLTVIVGIAIITDGTKSYNTSNYERDMHLENPCDFMNSGQYSVNC